MKIEIEVSDIDNLIIVLNNSFKAYSDILWAINLGLSPQVNSSDFKNLEHLSKSQVKAQINVMKSLLYQFTKKGYK